MKAANTCGPVNLTSSSSFQFLPGNVSGELLVDISSGPNLYQVLSGCEESNRMILTDLNRQELRCWLQDEGDCDIDWTSSLQRVCKLEGHLDYIATALASCVHSCNPIESSPGRALQSVSPDLAAFTRALGHIQELQRPGSHLLLIGALGENY
ncbi:phenylethanolamine N-methyltransferase-like [Morone saxatilis]|uniref:phenylethanolamine N-methyltransferase-like n=1 Tax=Morone saxatilis TaxID=34816 RepID=UPI0015E21A93|nr:phenylethanolamine N-methyltransferase-like [Morone saxatilis]